MSQVTVWHMTEEERLAYIKKHPIKPTAKSKKKGDSAFSNISKDYVWRGKRAAEARWGEK